MPKERVTQTAILKACESEFHALRKYALFMKISVPEYCLKLPLRHFLFWHKSVWAKKIFNRSAKLKLVCWTIGKSLVLFFEACERDFHALL